MEFRTGVYVGRDCAISHLRDGYDALLLAGGSTIPRDLPVPGRELDGVHFAMDYLTQQNRIIAGQPVNPDERITAEGKRVVILGGGDTGSDCLGTAHRQGAEIIYQLELLPEPPVERRPDNPWPQWSAILRTSSSHEEGGVRDYNILTRSFNGSGKVEKLSGVRLEWGPPDETGRPAMLEVPGSEFELDVDLVLLAMGFIHPEHGDMLGDLGFGDGRPRQREQGRRHDDERRGRVHGGRHVSRPVAGGVGARGGQGGGTRHRPLPDGKNDAAARAGLIQD